MSIVGNFRFLVAVDEAMGVAPGAAGFLAAARLIGKGAGFQEVTGLGAELEVQPYAEGGFNTFAHQLPVRHTYPRMVLKRGVLVESSLWNWYRAGLFGTLGARRGGVVTLNDSTGDAVMAWAFVGGLAVKWTGPTLNAMQNEVAVESIEIAHEGLMQLLPL